MKTLFKYLAIVIAIVAIIDLAYRAICSHVFAQLDDTSEVAKKFKFATNREQSDILILGDSRAVNHYNTPMMTDSLHVPCYNAGCAATGIVHSYLCFLKARNNGRIKLVILEVSAGHMSEAQNTSHLSSAFPYYWQDDTVHSVLAPILPLWRRLSLISALVQYNSFLHDVARARLQPSTVPHGYIPIPATARMEQKGFNVRTDTSAYKPYPRAVQFLHRIIKECKQEDIQLVICQSPIIDRQPAYDDFLRQTAKHFGVPYWDITTLPATMHPQYFRDPRHLNSAGADIFTQEIIRRLKQK